MKLRFDPSLQYQLDAINAVVDVFDGQPFARAEAAAFNAFQTAGLFQTELGIANRLLVPEGELARNVHRVQERNGIEKSATRIRPTAAERVMESTPCPDRTEDQEFLADRPDLSIEMETGTGKTYVYLRTLFELNKTYGFKKFIVVVPSVAIREGVLKSIEMMKEHFQTLYENTPFEHFVYDSGRLGKLRQFAMSNQIQIMVINIQSFRKDVSGTALSEMTEDELKKLNVINRENDRMSGRRPIEFIRAVRPIIVIDEPQSADSTGKSRRAIRSLDPLMTLRYSATHRNSRNLLYKLDPIKAYDLRLVKRIEVASVRSDDSFSDAYVKLLETDNAKGIKARLEIHKEGPSGPKLARLWVKQGDDLYVKSGERSAYRDGYILRNIDCTPGSERIEFSQGRFLERGREIGGLGDDLMRAQVRETVEQHLKKERTLKGKGIKILSLIFIDRVANYRIYNDDGTTSLGKIGRWFEDAYREFTAKPAYKGLIPFDVSEVHNGYFSRDKDGCARDTRGNSIADEDTYNLIMREKERLLDPKVALRFVFSHSALREGWDNPNVFQICTLNETQSKEKKRQEIGRGLRLSVNERGERVRDETVNRLTVIANESYEDFARKLQTEFEEDSGIGFGRVNKVAFAGLGRTAGDGTEMAIGRDSSARIWAGLVQNGYLSEAGRILDKFDPANPDFELMLPDEFADLQAEIVDEISRKVFKNRIVNARQRHDLRLRKEVQLGLEFQEMWERIRHRTRRRVTFDTAELIERALSRIRRLETIQPPRVVTTVAEVDFSKAGAAAGTQVTTKVQEVDRVKVLPDLLAFLQGETGLTRRTLAEILKRSGRLAEFKASPQAFMAAVAKEISSALHDLMLKGIKHEKIAGIHCEQSRIEQEAEDGIVRYLSDLHEVQNRGKPLFDFVDYKSEVERRFARDLDSNENVKMFTRLPSWFKIDTPVGPHNSNWAFVTEREQKLYFVRETKRNPDSKKRRAKENEEVIRDRKHFKCRSNTPRFR